MRKIILIVSIFIVIILGLLVRFWELGTIPPGLNRDEASIGYTAFSILKTGKDEYGTPLPIAIKSFGDWKLPLLIYFSIPFVAIFGLSDWSIRLLSSLAGIGTIIIIYFMAKFIFKSQRNPKIIAIISAITLALLPWHIHFSRTAYEANLALFFCSFATLSFLKGIKKPIWLIISCLLFSLTLYTYHAYQIFTPMFGTGLLLLYKKQVFVKKNTSILVFSFLLLSVLGIFLFFKTFSGNQTKSSISFINDPVFVYTNIELPRQNANNLIGKIIYNKPVIYSFTFIKNYLNSFSPNFLAIKGGQHPIHNFPGIANLFWFEYPLMIVGLYFLFKNFRNNQEVKIIILWLIIGPIASSITKDAPSSVRLSPLIVPFVLIIGLASLRLFEWLKNYRSKYYLLTVSTLVVIVSMYFYFVSYFVNFPQLRANNWGAGYQKLTFFLNQPDNIDKIVYFNYPNYSPYIYLLFYEKYDPTKYQSEAVRYSPTTDGFYHVKRFGRYQFIDNPALESVSENQLLVLRADQITDKQKNDLGEYLKTIIYDYGQPIFYVFEGQKSLALLDW